MIDIIILQPAGLGAVSRESAPMPPGAADGLHLYRLNMTLDDLDVSEIQLTVTVDPVMINEEQEPRRVQALVLRPS